MKVAVLGSGIIGISSAWWLSQAGHDVVVIDRCTGPAQETSLANGAQISVSYAEPWANPQAPFKLLKWMFQEDAPLLFRPQLDWRQWMWGLAFLRECLPGRLAPNIRAMVRMAEYSRATLRAMRADLGIQYDHLERGILNFYRDPQEFENSQRAAGLMRDFGVERRVVSADEVIAIEPALAPHRNTIVGGDYTPEDESGDVHLFTVALAEHCARAGVEFRYNTQATRLLTAGGNVAGRRADRSGRPLRHAVGRRLRGGDGQLQSRHAASTGHPLQRLSGQGLFGDLPDRQARCRARGQPDGQQPQDRLFAAGRPAAHGRHGRAVGLFPWPEHRALRGAYPPRPPTFPTRSISSASVLVGLRPSTPPTCPSSAAVVSPICMSTRDTVRSAGRWVLAQAGPWLTWSAGASLNRNFLPWSVNL